MANLKIMLVMYLCFTGGLMISSAVFAFITAIGLVPNIAFKTKTTNYIKYFEECIIFGGIFGTCYSFIKYDIPIGQFLLGKIFIIIFAFAIGIFFGVLASSLAETLDVIPVFTKRAGLKKGLAIFMIAIGIGKLVGAILYFTTKGFQV